MKNFSISILVFLAFLSVTSCTERGPNIQLEEERRLLDTTYVDMNLPAKQHKVVLLEEFTGVQCNNCPKGHKTSKDIKAAHGDSVVLVAIQNDNPLAKPYTGYPDFRTQEGIQISQNVGGSFAIPCAAVDRVQFSGQNQIVLYSRNFWETYTQQRIKADIPCNLELEIEYNETDRTVIVSTKIHYLEDVDSLTHLSIMVLEDDIVSPQKQPDNSTDSNYVHKHMLRAMITPALGSITNATTGEGRVIIRDYEYLIPDNFVPENLSFVAFVHRIGGNQRVLQAAKTEID